MQVDIAPISLPFLKEDFEKDESPSIVVLEHFVKVSQESHVYPCTESQKKVFDQSQKVNHLCNKWLGWRGYLVIGLTAACSALAGVRITKYAGYDDTSIANDLIPACITLVSAVGASLLSMIFTGTYPDRKSDEANNEQDILVGIEDMINQAALRLLRLRFSKKEDKKERSAYFARKIDVERIKEKFCRFSTQASSSAACLSKLKQAVAYVKDGVKPTNEDLLSFIRPLKQRLSVQ